MKSLIQSLFLSLVLTTFASVAYSQSIISVNAKPQSKVEMADISFTVTNQAVNKVFVRVPKSKELIEIDVSEERVQFIKVKLSPGSNIINLQAFTNDTFVDNTPVKIEYDTKPGGVISESGISPKPSVSTTGDGSDNAVKGKISFAEDFPSETSKPRITAKILIVDNLPLEAHDFYVENVGKKLDTENTIAKVGETTVNPQEVFVRLTEKENNIKVSVRNSKKEIIKTVSPITKSIYCDEPCEYIPRSINTRAIVGIEQTGASSANSETRPFINLFVNAPISLHGSRNPHFSAWADFRFTSTTVQSFASLANVSNTVLNPFFTQDTSINNIVQSFQVNAGIDYRIISEGALQSFFLPGKNSVSLIAGGGVTNPLKSEQSAQVFKIPTVNGQLNTAFTQLFPEIDFTGKTNIAFVSPERDRFFRRWFAGVRLKTRFYANENENSIIDQAPATFDVTIGQDEAITRKLTGRILNLEGFTPFPVKRLDFIYLFGGVTTRLTRRVNETIPPFFLQPITDFNLSDNNTVAVPIDSSPFTRTNRDTFRFGFGIDLIRLLNRTKDSTP